MNVTTAIANIKDGFKIGGKLVEVVKNLYRPIYTRHQADANAYSIQKAAQSIRENPDMDIIFEDGKVSVKQCAEKTLLVRARQRNLASDLRREANIENVIKVANEELALTQTDAKSSEETVDQDWLTRFFNITQDISNKDLQFIWGKILAGEIVKPKSFSLRTLEVLRNMNAEEARTFQKLMPLVLYNHSNCFIISNGELLKKYNLFFTDILLLDECRLLTLNETTSYRSDVSNETQSWVQNGENALLIYGTRAKRERITYRIYALTKVARELYGILACEPNRDYLFDVAKYIFDENPQKSIALSVHNIISPKNSMGAKELKYENKALCMHTRTIPWN